VSGISASIITNVNANVGTAFLPRQGRVVPETEDVAARHGAVELDATYVYADLADSSGAAQKLRKEVTGKIITSYLDAATRILRHYRGEVRSFDGDRVMAIFIGNDKNFRAPRAALAINWAVQNVIRPTLLQAWPSLNQYWTAAHGVGIATGEALIVRGGVRANNDLISIGDAPNVAAKLSAIRGGPSSYMTEAVYNDMPEALRRSADGRQMWSWFAPQTIGTKHYKVVASTWWWEP
jgi:adenylate cyclase